MNHTPTPWHIESTTSDELGVDLCAGDSRIMRTYTWIASINGTHDNSEGFPKTTEECLANAAFIVRAVNAHEALLNSARISLKYMDHVKGWSSHGPSSVSSSELADDLRAAIALAEVKS